MEFNLTQEQNYYTELLQQRLKGKITQEEMEGKIYGYIIENRLFENFRFKFLIPAEDFYNKLKSRTKARLSQDGLKNLYQRAINSVYATNISNLVFLLNMREFRKKHDAFIPDEVEELIKELRDNLPEQANELKEAMREGKRKKKGWEV